MTSSKSPVASKTMWAAFATFAAGVFVASDVDVSENQILAVIDWVAEAGIVIGPIFVVIFRAITQKVLRW